MAARSGPARSPVASPMVMAAAALAAAMGIGRFVYTPILPLMRAQTGMSHADTAWLATANYLGYFIGAIAVMSRPRSAHRASVYRTWLAILVASQVAMVLHPGMIVWVVARLAAGVGSAVVFVATATVLARSAASDIGYAGVGVGIALSGLIVAALESAVSWAGLWLVSAAVATALTAAAWRLPVRDPDPPPGPPPATSRRAGPGAPRTRRRAAAHATGPRAWALLGTAYFLEGVGYIILGTFLSAAISAGSGVRWSGPVAWLLVGVAAGCSLRPWAHARRHRSPELLLVAALALQAVAALLPAVIGGLAVAGVSAVVFGGTFMAAVMFAMESGALMRMPHAAATLTVGYALGQILGPLVVAPLLTGGYRVPFIVAAALLLGGAICAVPLTRRTRAPSGASG